MKASKSMNVNEGSAEEEINTQKERNTQKCKLSIVVATAAPVFIKIFFLNI